MATINHGSGADIIVPSNNGTTYRGLAGDDTYIISNSIAANASVTIVDTSGANKIQLVDGLSVKSSKFAADAVQLTLSNGAVVTINGASNFTFDVGGNATTGTAGSSNTLAQFASAMGVATLPSSGSTDGSADITIANNGVSGSAAPTFTITKDATSVTEGGSVTFTITASSAVSADTSFSWSVIGDNNGGTIDKAGTSDIDVLSGTATIAAGASSTTFSVAAASDAIVEGIEGIKVSVFDANASALSSDTILINNAGSSATSQSFTLTTGVNEMTGGSGNDSFDGSTNDSLNDFDVLDGAGGTDTLTFKTANLDGGVTFIPQLSNIEVIQVTAADADSTASDDIATVQLSGIAGITKLANIASAEDVVFDTVGNLVDIDLKSPKEDTTVTFTDAALAGAADEINVTIKGTQANTSLVINDAGVLTNSLETVHIHSLAVANSLDHDLSGVSPSTLKISGDKRLTLEDTTDATVVTVDASASSGGVTLAGTGYANATIHGGSGADVITAAPTGLANLSLGAGNDTVDFNATLTALDVVDGGDGTDTLTISGGNLTQVSVLGGVSNIEILKLDSAHTITLESNIGPQTFNFRDDTDQVLNLNDGYTNDTTVDIIGDDTNADSIINTANVTLNVIGNAEDFDGDVNTTITGGTGTDTLTIRNFTDGGEAEIAANITGVDKITYVDVTAGADTTLTIGAYTLSATYALALTIDASELDGGVAPEIFTLAGANSVTRMDITGGGAGDVLTLGTLADTVDGGAGADSITGTSGNNVITGGAGNDTVVAGTGNETIDTGDGNDYLNLAGNLNSGDTIDGGAGTDTMTISSGISTASVMGGVSNIEVLAVTGAVTVVANGDLGGANTFDFSAEADQVLTLTSAAAGGTYTGDTTVMLTNLAAGTTDATGADTITNSKDVTLNVIGNAASFDAGVTITGGATAVDTLTVIADGADAILSGATYINKVVIQDSTTQGTDVEITPKATDLTTPALEIDGTALDSGAGAADETLTLDGDSVTATVLTATGGKGADTLLGGALNDVLDGGAGQDQLNGNGGVDNLSGGAANDTFIVDSVAETYSTAYAAATTMDGGAGTDTVAFQSAQTHTATTLAGISNTEIWTLPEDSNFTISDAVLANNPGLSIRISGNGTLSGGEDTAGGALMTSSINVTSTAAGNLNLIGSSGADTFTFYATESLTADDSIDGNAGEDIIYIVNDDNLNAVGDATSATFGANTKGIEKIVITDASADDNAGDVTITINNGYLDTALTVDGSQQDMNSITLTNEERLTLTSNDVNVALTVLGGAGADSITTNAGLDHITAGGGADSIATGDGADTIYGGAGIDAIRGEGGTDYIDAGAGNDVITVDDFSDFQTSGGVETVKGGAGTDTLSFTEAVALDLSAPELEHLYGIEVISLDRTSDTASKITLGNATFDNLGSSVLTIVGNFHTGDDADNEIDASAVTNGSIVVTGNPRTTVNDTIKGGSGDDIFRFSGTANLEDGDVLDGNGGSDTIQLDASSAAVTVAIDFDDVTDMEVISVYKGTAATDAGDVTVTIEDNDALTAAQEGALSLTVDATAMTANNFIFNSGGTDDIDTKLTITGGGKADTITGSSGHDTISGGSYTTGDGGDILSGGSGNDSITGNAGPDTINGEEGNDVMLEGGAGADSINGGAGNDTMSGGTGADVLTGAGGADNLTGGAGNDSFNFAAVTDSQTSAVDTITDFTQSTLNATTGALVTEGDNVRLTFTMGNSDDIMTFSDKGDETQGLVTSLLSGNTKGDFAFATDINTLFIDMDGDGTLNADDYKIKLTGLTTFHDDDLDLYVTVGTGGDTFTGADGDDSITANSGADSLYGDGGNDTITASANNGANKIHGGPGDDSLVGGSAADSILGGDTTTDTATGSSGNDTISSGAGGDTVYGGEGADSITGGSGADSIYGQLGNDTISSAGGADSVQGNEGNDSITDAGGASSLQGGAGNDTIKGGAGVDTMVGGDGNDTFDLTDVTALANRAVITDFVSGSDILKLEADNTTDGTAAGSAPVMGKSDTASPADGQAYAPSVSTTTNDIIELQTASLANAANATLGAGQDLVDSEELFKAMAAAGANNEISQITATTAGDKFYIVAYDNNDMFIYYADAGSGNAAVVKAEVNLVASITGTGNFAVDALEASDFLLG